MVKIPNIEIGLQYSIIQSDLSTDHIFIQTPTKLDGMEMKVNTKGI